MNRLGQHFAATGRHVVVDMWGVDFFKLNNLHLLEKHLRLAAERCGATVLSTQYQQFEPQGATVLALLSESHISVHTYPEQGFAALDCYTCGEGVAPQLAVDYMLNVLKPERTYQRSLIRGRGPIADD